jgi:hypothetical protein
MGLGIGSGSGFEPTLEPDWISIQEFCVSGSKGKEKEGNEEKKLPFMQFTFYLETERQEI